MICAGKAGSAAADNGNLLAVLLAALLISEAVLDTEIADESLKFMEINGFVQMFTAAVILARMCASASYACRKRVDIGYKFPRVGIRSSVSDCVQCSADIVACKACLSSRTHLQYPGRTFDRAYAASCALVLIDLNTECIYVLTDRSCIMY